MLPDWWYESLTPRLQERVAGLPLETISLGRVTLRRLITARRLALSAPLLAAVPPLAIHGSANPVLLVICAMLSLPVGMTWLLLLRLGYRHGKRLDAARARLACEKLEWWYRVPSIAAVTVLTLTTGLAAVETPEAALMSGLTITMLWMPLYISQVHVQLLGALIGLLGTTPPPQPVRRPTPSVRDRLSQAFLRPTPNSPCLTCPRWWFRRAYSRTTQRWFSFPSIY